MSPTEELESLSREELLALVLQLQRKLSELGASVQDLRAEVDRLTRQSKRQATPFSKGTRSNQPECPGRKPGEGTFSFRQAPRPEDITDPPVDVPVTLESCPRCGGKLRERRVDFAYVTELPTMPRPKVTQYRVWVCRCTGCGRKVRGEHADLAPEQYGATAHRVGPRAMAAAHALHYQVGIPVRKVPLVLALLTGMELTQGSITQACPEHSRRDALRRAKGTVGAAYQELRHSIRDSPAVYTDYTGWKVGGENAHLMAFDTDQATVYQVRPRHRHQEVQEIVPRNYQGVMVTDRGRSYEAHSFMRVKQQKCLAHLQKALSTLLEKKRGRAREFGENLKMLFRMALELWERYHAGETTDFVTKAAELRLVISYLLRERSLRDPDNRHLLKVLRRYHRRGELLRFLEDPGIEPTNNRVERALRPAVIARKVSQCSKNDAGAYAFSAFKSIV
jgi:transposase